MDPRIAALKTTTFSGRRPARRQIVQIRDTVAFLPGNSRAELCKTICEHPDWKTARGDCKVGACMAMLESLEREGILALPAKRDQNRRLFDRKPVRAGESDPQPDIRAKLADLAPLRLEPVEDAEGRQLWNALVDRHHYLGYRQPFGAHVRYFLADRRGRRLGCLLLESSTKTLPARDAWIGRATASATATGTSSRTTPGS